MLTMPTQLAIDLEQSPPPPTSFPSPATPPADPVNRRGSLLIVTVLTAILAVVAAWAAGPIGHGASAPAPRMAPAGARSGLPAAHPAPAPSPAGSAAASAVGAPAKVVVPPPTDPGGVLWATRDSDVLSASTAPYFIAGTVYGDPPGNKFGVVTMSHSTEIHVRRGGKSGATLGQMQQAVQAFGGTTDVRHAKGGGGKIGFWLASGTSIVVDTYGSVTINGHDALGLRQTSAGWTSTATGPQVRAFLAGFIEGEGNVKGKIGDDPSSAHLTLIKNLMMTPQAYSVPTVLEGSRYFQLFVASASYDPRVQAYPFSTYSRVPGGKP
jgi:hypothetical protein